MKVWSTNSWYFTEASYDDVAKPLTCSGVLRCQAMGVLGEKKNIDIHTELDFVILGFSQ